jgi:hypothetical protein
MSMICPSRIVKTRNRSWRVPAVFFPGGGRDDLVVADLLVLRADTILALPQAYRRAFLNVSGRA